MFTEDPCAEVEKFRDLAENVREVFFITGPGGAPMLYASPAYERVWGRPRAELERDAHAWKEAIHPEDRDGVERSIRAAAGGQDIEYRIVRPDGSIRWILASTAVVKDAAGRPARLVGIAKDITDRKAAEEALRRGEERFRAMIENSSDGIVVLDANGTVVYASGTILRILGYDPAEYVGRNAFDYVYPDDLQRTRSVFRKGLEHPDHVVRAEYRYRSRDGSWRQMECVGVNRLHDPAVRGFIVNYRDVSDRKGLESQLRQAQKMEAVGRLAGGIAHDFNNLLTVINGYSDLLLLDLPPDDPARERLQEIRRAGERAAGLTRQLLAFSRRQMLQPRVIDLNSVVADMDKLLRRVIGEDVDLRTVLDPALGRVKADPGQVEQVIMNLAVNARDAMSQGGRLTIETANADLDPAYVREHPVVVPGRYVMLAVSDTGVGMDDAVKAHLFEPFFTTKEKGKGTGLGLATVYGIVKQSGGYVWAYSEAGKGATFKVYLPRVAEGTPSGSEPGAAARPAGGTETILVAEDEGGVRALAREVLRGRGYAVLDAPGGEEALAAAREHRGRIHLLLTDVVMPRMGGPALARALVAERPETRVLYMSGYAAEAVVHQEILAAGTRIVQKPFTPDGLARAVREALDVPSP